MLMLTRRINESVIIDNNIKITVIGVDRGCIKLGFEAPEEVVIVREELLDVENEILKYNS